MSNEVLFFTIEGLQAVDLVPWPPILLVTLVLLGPFMLAPVFMAESTEATGKRPMTAMTVLLVGVLGGAFFLEQSALTTQQTALAAGEVETIDGVYEGPVEEDYLIFHHVQGIRVSGQVIAPPGGYFGAVSPKILPTYLPIGENVSVAVAEDRYLKVTLQ